MANMRHSSSVANLSEKQLRHEHPTSKMKISKSAPDLLKKAATSLKSKTDALRTKLVVLASMRRRMAMVALISRRMHSLVSSDREKRARVEHGGDRALVPCEPATAASKEAADGDHGGTGKAGLGLFEVAVFEEEDHGYPDWTRALFDDDDNCHNDEEAANPEDYDDLDVLGSLDDEPSVMEVIRSNREVQGLEFNMDDEVDEACDMFIRRFRSRMNRSCC